MERRAGGRFFFLCLVLWMLHISCFSPDERMCDETTAAAAAAALHKHWEGSQGTYWVEVGSASTLRGEIRGLWLDQCTLGRSHILTFRCFVFLVLASKSAIRASAVISEAERLRQTKHPAAESCAEVGAICGFDALVGLSGSFHLMHFCCLRQASCQPYNNMPTPVWIDQWRRTGHCEKMEF